MARFLASGAISRRPDRGRRERQPTHQLLSGDHGCQRRRHDLRSSPRRLGERLYRWRAAFANRGAFRRHHGPGVAVPRAQQARHVTAPRSCSAEQPETVSLETFGRVGLSPHTGPPQTRKA